MQKSLIILTLAFIALSGCTERIEIPEQSNDFEIYYSFGVFEKNVLDTENNLYIQDLICDGSTKEHVFILSEAEKQTIYNAIRDNDLFNIKNEFTENCNLVGTCMDVTPLTTSTLKIQADGKTKEIIYRGNYIHRDDPELKKFNKVTITIQEIILQKRNELGIEKSKCGYV